MAKVPNDYKITTTDNTTDYYIKARPNTTVITQLNEHLMDMIICTLALQLGFNAIQLYKLNNAMRNMMDMSWDIQRKYEWLTQTAYAIKTGDEHYGGF